MGPSEPLVPKFPVHNTNTCGSRRKTKHEKLNSSASFAGLTRALSAPQTHLEQLNHCDSQPAVTLIQAQEFDSDLEMKAKFQCLCTGCHKVCPAEGRQEIIEGGLVRQIDDCKPQTPLVAVAVEQVVMPNARVEEVPGSDTRRIPVRVIRPWRRQTQQLGPKRGLSVAHWRRQRGCECRNKRSTKQSNGCLLVG